MAATIFAPSLCEQSELQCFASDLRRMFARRRLQLCRYNLLIIVICTLNDVPSKRINSVIKQLYALNAEMSIMIESTKVIPALLPKYRNSGETREEDYSDFKFSQNGRSLCCMNATTSVKDSSPLYVIFRMKAAHLTCICRLDPNSFLKNIVSPL